MSADNASHEIPIARLGQLTATVSARLGSPGPAAFTAGLGGWRCRRNKKPGFWVGAEFRDGVAGSTDRLQRNLDRILVMVIV